MSPTAVTNHYQALKPISIDEMMRIGRILAKNLFPFNLESEIFNLNEFYQLF